MRLPDLLAAAGLFLVDGADRADSAAVSWVHTTELLDPTMYLSGGELILTTGLWRGEDQGTERFVAALTAAGVSALGYGLDRPGVAVPADVRAACAEHGLALVAVPYETPFIAISKAFVEWLTAEQQRWLLSSVRRSEAMTAAIATGRGAAGVLRVLRREAGLKAAVTTRTGEVLATTGPPLKPEQLTRLLAEVRATAADPYELPEPPGPAIVFAIHATDAADGYLVCWTSSPLPDDLRAAIDQTVTFLGLELARVQAIRSTELRFSGELLDLMNAGPRRLAELQERLVTLGLDPHGQLTALAVTTEHVTTNEPEVAALERVVRESGVRAVLIVRDDAHLLVMQVGQPPGPAEVARRTLGTLERDDVVHAAAVGLGSTVVGAGDLLTSVNEARQACALAGYGSARYSVAQAGQAGSHSLLLALAKPEVRDSLVSSLISPLRDYDELRRTELVRTLDVFLAGGGHWQSTAHLLHIHVNTLRHRIARIESLTGRSVSAMADRVDFFLALRAANNVF